MVLHASPLLRRALYPLLIASQTIPIVVLAPILAIIMGYNIGPKLVVVGLVCFFPDRDQHPRRAALGGLGLRAHDAHAARHALAHIPPASSCLGAAALLSPACAWPPRSRPWARFSASSPARNDGLGFVCSRPARSSRRAACSLPVLLLNSHVDLAGAGRLALGATHRALGTSTEEEHMKRRSWPRCWRCWPWAWWRSPRAAAATSRAVREHGGRREHPGAPAATTAHRRRSSR